MGPRVGNAGARCLASSWHVAGTPYPGGSGPLVALREADVAVAAYRARDYLPAHEIHAAIRGRWPIPYDFAADPEARAAVGASLAEFQPFETASTPSAAFAAPP